MSMHRCERDLVLVVHACKFFCTFFLTSSNKRIMIRLDKSLTSLQRDFDANTDEDDDVSKTVAVPAGRNRQGASRC